MSDRRKKKIKFHSCVISEKIHRCLCPFSKLKPECKKTNGKIQIGKMLIVQVSKPLRQQLVGVPRASITAALSLLITSLPVPATQKHNYDVTMSPPTTMQQEWCSLGNALYSVCTSVSRSVFLFKYLLEIYCRTQGHFFC